MNLAEWWPWILLAAICATALVALLYRRPELKPGWRALFIILRGAVLTLLALLFADLACQTRRPLDSPAAGIIVDDSASMSLADSEGRTRSESALEMVEAVQSAHPGLDWVVYEQGELSEGGMPDAVRTLASRRPDLSAAVVIGDGGGGIPAANLVLPFPVHALAAGGESLFDVALSTPRGPRLSLVEKPALFEIGVNLVGTGPAETIVRADAREIFGGRRTAELGAVEVDLSGTASTADFRFTPPTQGWWLIEFSTPPLEAEAVISNNARSLLINVRRGELTSLILAGEPGPESSFLYRSLQNLPGVEAELLYRRPDGNFYDAEGDRREPDLVSPDALFLVDMVPRGYLMSGLLSRVNGGRGVGMILGRPGLTVPPDSAVWEIFPVGRPDTTVRLVEGQSRVVRVSGRPFGGLLYADLPAFTTWPEGLRVTGAAGVVMSNPVGRRVPGAFLTVSGAPRLLMLGRGWWRWSYSGRTGGAENVYDDLVADLFAYLSAPATDDRLSISLDRRRTRVGIPVNLELTGGENMPTCVVRDLAGGEESEVALSPLGEGRWRGSLTFAEEGTYIVRAEREGRYVEEPLTVEPDFTEFSDLAPDATGLARLASSAGGRLLADPTDELPLGPGASLDVVEREPLRASPWLLGALVLLIVVEWFLRRRQNLR